MPSACWITKTQFPVYTHIPYITKQYNCGQYLVYYNAQSLKEQTLKLWMPTFPSRQEAANQLSSLLAHPPFHTLPGYQKPSQHHAIDMDFFKWTLKWKVENKNQVF